MAFFYTKPYLFYLDMATYYIYDFHMHSQPHTKFFFSQQIPASAGG